MQTRQGLLKWVLLTLALAFAWPLYGLVRFALKSELYSYVLLVPIISAYMARTTRQTHSEHSPPLQGLAAVLAIIGISLMAGFWAMRFSGRTLDQQDSISLVIGSLVCLVWSACAFLLNRDRLSTIAFPLLFLVFFVPWPLFAQRSVEGFLQHASADSAYLLIQAAGTPILRTGTSFQMPGLRLEVAPECSGIHSSLMLLITALLAGHLLFKRPFTKVILALAVVPLGILRNAFRIFILSELTLHVNPDTMDSWLHHHGGPIFFLVSLGPLVLLILLLRKYDRRTKVPATRAV